MAKKTIILDKEGKDTGEAVGPDQDYASWLLRQSAIGLGETPGLFGTIYGLSGAAKDYLLAPKDDPRSFSEHLLDPNEGKQKLDNYNEGVIRHLREKHPDYSAEELEKRFEYIQKHSKKYYKDASEFMRPGVSFARKWNVGTNEYFGDPRLPTEKTMADDAVNVLGGSAPLPGVGTLLKGAGTTGTKVAAHLAANAPSRYAVNVAEAFTPATLIPPGASAAGITGRVGANVAAGTALNQGVRAYEGNPSYLGDPTETPSRVVKKDDGTGNIAAVGAVSAIATILGAKAAKNWYKGVAKPPIGGPSREAMEAVAHPEPNLTAAQVGSTIAPIEKMARAAGLPDEDVKILMDKMERVDGPMAKADHDLWVAEKMHPITEKFIREDPQFQTLFQQHIADRIRIYRDVDDLKQVDDDIVKAQSVLNSAMKARVGSSPAAVAAKHHRIREATDAVNELHQEKAARLADTDPNLRGTSMNQTRADVQARLRTSGADPRVQAVERQLIKLYDEVIDVPASQGIISPTTAARMKADIRKGNYSLGENPLNRKGWLETAKSKASKMTEDHLVFSHTDGALGLYRGIHNGNFRKGYETGVGANKRIKFVNPQPDWVPQARTNNPANPFHELQYLSIRNRQAAAANRMMKEYFETMKASPGNAGGRLVREVKRIPESDVGFMSKDIISKLDKKGAPYFNAYYDDGNLVVMSHNSRVIRDLFKFSPASIVPVLHQSRKLYQTFATGAFNPTWALIGMPWDVLMGGLFRNPQMAFGPVSGLAAKALGRGSLLARYISAAATPIDMVANLAKLPVVAAKAVITEIMGNQLAKRWQAQIATNSGVIGNIARLPGGQQIVSAIADTMAKAYDASWTHVTKAYKVGHVSNYSDELLDQMKKLDGAGKAYPMYKSALNSYRGVLSVLHDVPKQMFLSQNLKLYKRELAKGKKLEKFVNEDFIANEARKIGGDLARQSGNKYMQMAMSVTPYGNVALQSMRYTGQRIKNNGVEGMARYMAFGSAAAWAYNYVASDPKLANWYFNELPQEQRMQSLPLPNVIRHMRRMWGEDLPVDDPSKEVLLVRLPPEAIPLIVPVMHGMMAMGFIDSKKAVVPPELIKDFKQMTDQLFGLGLPPIVQAAGAYAGYKIEPTKALTGEAPIRQIRDVSFGGVNKDMMSPQSRIPHAWHDAFNAMFGTVAGTLMEGANYADVVARQTGSFKEGAIEGAKKLGVERAAKVPYAHHIWPDVNRRYIYTPATQKTAEDMSLLRKINQQFSNEPDLQKPSARDALSRSDEIELQGGSPGAEVTDEDVRTLIQDVHTDLFSGDMLQLQKERTAARKTHESLTIGPHTKTGGGYQSPLTRFKLAQKKAKEVNALDMEIHNLYQETWKELQSSPSGLAFRAKYGELTPENLAKVTAASARQPR